MSSKKLHLTKKQDRIRQEIMKDRRDYDHSKYICTRTCTRDARNKAKIVERKPEDAKDRTRT